MKSCSRKILELFYNAKHSGRVMKPDAIGRVGEDDDGLVIELTWRVVDGVIVEAKFRAFGNPNAIAITSLMTDNIIGKNIEEAMEMDESVITDNLDEFRPEYIEAYDMVHAAMVEAYNNYLKRQNRKAEMPQVKYVKVERELTEEEREAGLLHQVEDEISMVQVVETERRGRGRPRKPVDENAVVVVGEKRGRGRPRKERPEGEIEVVGEKRGRGRPRKIVDESEIVVTEKRGRGRPRKPVDENAVVVVGEKRGRGRPRKERPEGEIEVVGEKRGRGRPRKIVDESEIVATEKRGRGRPRKPVDENAIEEVGEKRGRGRPRKIVDEGQVKPLGEKRGRGRPKKDTLVINRLDLSGKTEENTDTIDEQVVSETKISLPNDFEQYDTNETIDEVIVSNQPNDFVSNLISNKLIDEDDETFDADYDLFKSNIRNIFSGKETSSTNYGQSKSNIVVEESKLETSTDNQNQTINVVETEDANAEQKRGRGRPRKVEVKVTEHVEHEKRGRGRPKLETVNSITRSLNTPGGVPMRNNTQDIVFASKNVTTTNININVTKTTTNVDEHESVSDYEKNINIESVNENVQTSIPAVMLEDKNSSEEIEIEPVKNDGIAFKDIEDDFDDFDEIENDDEIEDIEDGEEVKDEAPKGGIADLLKALLGD